ncbi:MAG TPA: hypoxanthine phosphoribosyltransferase [Saprospiraceae bacterium]|nr:hypoxanthine phosphoribosyltransferase [Saprospiraceae bacterium]HMQ82857.1 hypoxanthine phosphoribosyltransferase [Saprospiraceae bacterium]
MTTTVKIHDLEFEPFLSKALIADRVQELGIQISTDYEGKMPLFLGILNGAFVFAADLIRACSIPCEVAFMRLASYDGLQSSGAVRTLVGLDSNIKDRHVIVVEDIVDSGRTLSHLMPQLQALQPASLALATLLFKPDALESAVDIDYLAFEIPNRFVVGYGLDYNGLGRNLPDIYQLKP